MHLRTWMHDWNPRQQSDLMGSAMFSREYVKPAETLSGDLFADELDDSSESMDIDIADLEDLDLKQDEPGKTVPRPIKLEHEDMEGSDSEGSDGSGNSSDTSDDYAFADELVVMRKCPGENSTLGNEDDVTVPMTPIEETQLLEQLTGAGTVLALSTAACRLACKLRVRQRKRALGCAVLDLDSACAPWLGRRHSSRNRPRVLDRFQHAATKKWKEEYKDCCFSMRLCGEVEPCNFYSAYTHRHLPAFIWHDKDVSSVLWLNLMDQLLERVNGSDPDWIPPKRSCIDYCYVRPQHIGIINHLCNKFFYPGIDLTEVLSYPDFSCIAMYKRLVVGYAFLVPDVGDNEAYISFVFTRPEWRRSGIATFMVYHLVQTCMGKDITLHCSSNNPAIVLYQKFGFKVEEYMQDFYDQYFPVESKECKDAVFLRLHR